MLVSVTDLEYLGGYTFKIRFSDGMSGKWDYTYVKKRSGPMAEPLKEETYIARAFLEFGAPTWPNGWDVSPEALYADLLAADKLKREEEAA